MLYVLLHFYFFIYFCPPAEGGGSLSLLHAVYAVPLLSVHYCIMQGCIFQAWLTVIRKLNGGKNPTTSVLG